MIRPVIMAGGEGRRMQLQETSKLMLSVDRITPLIGNAAVRFLNNGYREQDVTVVTGAYKEQITNYLGSSFSYHEQLSIGDPTDGVMGLIQEWGLAESDSTQTLMAVMNGDDACWNTTEKIQELLNMCDKGGHEGMLLSTSYEHGQHRMGFIHSENKLKHSTTGYHALAAYAAGFFVINPVKFNSYINNTRSPSRGNIVTYFRDHKNKNEVAVNIDTEPRVCVNTRDALFQARHLYDRRI